MLRYLFVESIYALLFFSIFILTAYLIYRKSLLVLVLFLVLIITSYIAFNFNPSPFGSVAILREKLGIRPVSIFHFPFSFKGMLVRLLHTLMIASLFSLFFVTIVSLSKNKYVYLALLFLFMYAMPHVTLMQLPAVAEFIKPLIVLYFVIELLRPERQIY